MIKIDKVRQANEFWGNHGYCIRQAELRALPSSSCAGNQCGRLAWLRLWDTDKQALWWAEWEGLDVARRNGAVIALGWAIARVQIKPWPWPWRNLAHMEFCINTQASRKTSRCNLQTSFYIILLTLLSEITENGPENCHFDMINCHAAADAWLFLHLCGITV